VARVSDRRIAVGMSGHQRSRGVTDEWYTPPDPCAPRGGVPWIPASRSLSIDDNGLLAPWSGRVWLNPPYGAQTGLWLGKMAEHGNGVALVFARTDTAWFQTCAPRAAAVCFIAGRIRFLRPDGTPGNYTGGAPSCLLGFGPTAMRAVEKCELGVVGGVL
jgi:hypothetical protein